MYVAVLFLSSCLGEFNHGVVLTDRVLRPSELFEVEIVKMVDKWAGSIEIGVTTHRCVCVCMCVCVQPLAVEWNLSYCGGLVNCPVGVLILWVNLPK